MERILVTGGSGFIGSRIHHALGDVYDILPVSSGEMNILDRSAVNETFDGFRPDSVIHCAAVADTDFCNRNPERSHGVNVGGSVTVAEACARNRSRLVFLSTEQVFNGNTAPGPYTEADTPHPDTVYGRNKLEAEKRVRDICPDSLILRLTWMFGVPQRFRPAGGNLLWDTIGKIVSGEPFSVPVNEYRGLTDVDDLVRRLPEVLSLPPGTYHTGSRNPMNRYEAVCHIFRELGSARRIDELIRADTEMYATLPRDVRLDTTRLADAGITFPESPDAIGQCIREYGLSFPG